jgi:hypothetical protein
LVRSFVRKASTFTLIAGALVSSAVAQNYMYGQAGLQTGTKPSGAAIADFNGDGRPDFAVANQGDNTVSVMLTKPDSTFATKVDYAVGNAPLQLVTSDFNGDGIMDLAVVNSADNTISVLFGVGDGTFESPTTFPTGKNPVAIVAGDFNGDGNMDLAIANRTDDSITVLIGNGKGAFNTQPPVPINGAPYYLLSGDVNNDGTADIFVLASTANSGATLFLLSGVGNGAFSVSDVGGGTSVANMALGDFDNDGNLDVAFASGSAVSILLGNGAGAFVIRSFSIVGPLGAPAQSIAVGDFNHDGNLDLAVTQTYFIAVYPGNGDGTFGSPLLGGIPSFTSPLLLVPVDFNNDAQLDLVVVIPDYNVALILLGNGDGTLASRADITLPASGGLAGSVMADFNKDGKQDLALAQFNQPPQGSIQGFITTLSGNGDGTFQNPTSTLPSDVGIGQMISADFIGNGNVDLASADVNANGGIAVFLGSGNSMLGPPIDSFMGGTTPMNPGPIAAGDFNRDGKMDLIVGSENSGNNVSPLYVLLSQGDGTFKANLIYNLAYGFVPDVAVTDFNHDGFLDLAVTTQNELLVFLGRGDGTFQAPVPYTNTASFTNSVTTGDFNGDGKVDIVIGTAGAVLFYAGNGDGTFRTPVSTPTSLSMVTLMAADFNGDGLLDLATEGPSLSDSILLGNGDGTFHAATPFEATYYPRAYTVGDLNGDGVVDLVQFSTTNPRGTPPQTASLWLSTPSLSFTASSLQFSAQSVGTPSSAKTIMLSNAGNAPLSLSKIAASGDFSQANACANTLAVGGSCSIQVIFTPTANGARSGSLTFTDNAKPGTQKLALTGWAGPPDFVPLVSPTSVTVKAGSSATYSLVLTSGGGFLGTLQVSCSGAPSGANCVPSQKSVPLAVNSSARVKVTVSTMAPSSASLPLSFLSPKRVPSSTPFVLPMFGMALVCALGWMVMRRRFLRLLPAVVFSLVLAACGGGTSVITGPPPVTGTPTGNYTLTLTITSGTSSHTTTLTLVVQ